MLKKKQIYTVHEILGWAMYTSYLVHHSLQFRKRKSRSHLLRHQNWGLRGKFKFSPHFLGTFRLTLYQLHGLQMWCTDGRYQRCLICDVFFDHYHKVLKRKTRFAFLIEIHAIWLAWSLLFIVKTDHFHGKLVFCGRPVHFEYIWIRINCTEFVPIDLQIFPSLQ